MTQAPPITKLLGAPPIDPPCLVIVRPLPRLQGGAALTDERRMHVLTTGEIGCGVDIGTTQPKKPRKPRRPTLASTAKQASKAGIAVARYEVKPDGTVVVVTGQGEQQQGNAVDEWMAKHADKTQRH